MTTTTIDGIRARLIERADLGALELPVLPEIAQQALLMAADESQDMRALSDLMRRDASMAGHLLRIANSPHYAGGRSLTSIQQAISRLGMKAVAEIAMVISCQSPAFLVPGFEAEVRAQFRHALTTALYSQEIARIRRWSVDEAFLAGLLHDVGFPMLIHAAVGIARHAGLRLVTLEPVQSTFEDLHAALGSVVAESWGLAPSVVEAIGSHHETSWAADAEPTGAVVSLADAFAEWVESPDPALEELTLRSHPTLLRLNLCPDDLDRLIEKRAAIVGTLGALS